MEQLVELFEQIAELAKAGADALKGAAADSGEAPAPAEGEEAPPAEGGSGEEPPQY
jgi:hypothetical protein